MPYNIGQMRRDQYSSYTTNITYTLELLENDNSIMTFYDPCISLNGANAVSSLYSYYLRFEVTQLVDSVQDFTIRLQNREVENQNTQELKTYKVKQSNGGKATFEFIFTPNASYNQIIFELRRQPLDFTTEMNGKSGRVMDVKILQLSIVNNLITNYLSSNFDGTTELKKIGIQGPPGLLFTLNGEEIRVGRSGVYELYEEDIPITYIGFVIKDSLFTQDGKDYFILDFKY